MSEGYQLCIICNSEPPIRNSHVLPAFVFRWMIKTGGTRFLRPGDTPNKRLQDGLKYPLLCQTCESEASKSEAYFQAKIFKPSITSSEFPNKVGNDCYKFLCTNHLRVQKYILKEGTGTYSDSQTGLLKHSSERIASFLRKERYSISPFRVYLLALGLGSLNNSPETPRNWNRYIRRQTEFDIFGSESENIFGSYFKIGPWVSFLHIKNDSQPWYGSEVVNKSTRLSSKRSIVPPTVLNYLFDRAVRTEKLMRGLSTRQRQKIQQSILEGDLLTAGRPMFEAIMADYEAYGPSAFDR